MYHHVVLFWLTDPADLPRTVDVLRGMKGRIPTLRHVHAGPDDSPGPRSAHIALLTAFDDRAGYDTYTTHPVHLEVLAHMKTVVERSAKVDWAEG
jgi:hypothetical protein